MEAPRQIPVPLPTSFGTYAYVVVKSSLHATESLVLGLNKEEECAMVKYFQESPVSFLNGLTLPASPIKVINILSQLGYRVVTTTGESEIVWTMQREI